MLKGQAQAGPPWAARAVLRLILSAEVRGQVAADMDEEFGQKAAAEGRMAARRWYWRYAALSVRDWWKGGGVMRGWRMDLGVALRTLLRRPGFTVVALLTLGLGVGATTAVFGVVHGVLLRPLPYPGADRLYYLWERGASGGLGWVSAPNYEDWQAGLDSYEVVAAVTPAGFNAMGASRPERIEGMEVSPSFFRVLGVTPMVGRGFTEEEGRTPAARVAIISAGMWERQYGGDPAVQGTTLELDGEPHEVVGVMPADHEFPAGAEVWVPLDLGDAEWKRGRGTKWLNVVARLRSDVTPESARQERDALGAVMADEYAEVREGSGIAAVSLMDEVVGDVRTPLMILSGAVVLVLLVVCVNVAGLFLVRAASRRREAAIRLALGSSRSQLAGRFLAETLLLSTAGGALGLLFAVWAVRVLRALAPAGTPRLEDVTISGAMLVFGVGLSLIAGLVAGIQPALREAGTDLRSGLGSAGDTAGRRRWPRRALVLTQVALAVVLVVGSAHLLETFRRLRSTDPGFQPVGVLTAALPLAESRYETDEAVEAFYRELVRRVEALPGAGAAGVVSVLPMSGQSINFSFGLRDPGAFDEDDLVAGYQSASAGYFGAMGIPIIEGRPFRPGEGAADEPVVIVDETFADQFFPDGAVGQELLAIDDRWRRVVGVAGAVKRRSLRGDPEPMFYVPLGQDPRDAMTLVARTHGGDPLRLAPGVRAVVAEIDPQQPIARMTSMQSLVSSGLSQPRFTATIVAFFGLATLFLAMLGVYGIVSAMVLSRTRETGIRVALGARRVQIRRMVLAHGMVLVVSGAAFGLAVSVPAIRAIRGTLYGVAPFQPAIVGTAVVLTLLAGALACWLPARRATRVDPVDLLREG